MYFMLPITYLSEFERKGMHKYRGKDVNIVHACIDKFIPTDYDGFICSRSQLRHEYNYKQTICTRHTLSTR